MLYLELQKQRRYPYLLLEEEGKRIGNIHLPPSLFKAMAHGLKVQITAPLAVRVERILSEYVPAALEKEEQEKLHQSLLSLKNRLGAAKIAALLEKLSGQSYAAVAKIMCTEYYDRFYNEARREKEYFNLSIDAADLDLAVDTLAAFIDQTFSEKRRKECYHEPVRSGQ